MASNGKLAKVDQIRGIMTSPKMMEQFAMALPNHVHPDKFVRVVMTAVTQNEALQRANPKTLYAACMKSAQDGLMPDGREAAIVVYGDKAEYMPMTQGLMKLARNSGEVLKVSVRIVKANDEFSYVLGDEEMIIHGPALKDRGDTIGAYSIVHLKSGEVTREWMDVDQIIVIRDKTKAYRAYKAKKIKATPWADDFDEMCRKTVFKRHTKYLPKSTDLDMAVAYDNEHHGYEDLDAPAAPGPTADGPRQTRMEDLVDAKVEEPELREAEVEDVVEEAPEGPVNGGDPDPDDII